VSDVVLANLLRIWKKLCKAGYRVLFNNNGPVSPDLLCRWDHIQQVSPQYLNSALTAGIPKCKQTLLPSAVFILEHLTLMSEDEKATLRKTLQLPDDRKLILSVGAINKSRKRMDYLIREVAAMAKPRPYLLLLGAMETESFSILRLGEYLLKEGFEARSVEKNEVDDFYRVSDIFALASMDEGFGLAYVEALAHGLPCLVHDYPTSRYVLGEMGIYGDLSNAGDLGRMISGLTPADFSKQKAQARHVYAYERFSWERLKPQYVEMFKRCVERE
jgi:glycosyltransferase involved in cell wall biosynthesis